MIRQAYVYRCAWRCDVCHRGRAGSVALFLSTACGGCAGAAPLAPLPSPAIMIHVSLHFNRYRTRFASSCAQGESVMSVVQNHRPHSGRCSEFKNRDCTSRYLRTYAGRNLINVCFVKTILFSFG